jgi:circadian clock protein KaiB
LIRRGLVDSGDGPDARPAVQEGQKTTEVFEKLMAESSASAGPYALRLYVAGKSAKSARAIANVQALCERHLADKYELEIIDVRENPMVSKRDQIVATPALIRKLPLPLRRFVGDMSDHARILLGIGHRSKS